MKSKTSENPNSKSKMETPGRISTSTERRTVLLNSFYCQKRVFYCQKRVANRDISLDPTLASRRIISIRVKMDLVILADGGGQRFKDNRIEENILSIWFDHFATHDPKRWRDSKYQLPDKVDHIHVKEAETASADKP